MAKLKVLFLTYCYPPSKYPRSVQISHLVQGLKSSLSITVLSANPEKKTDDSMLNFTPLNNVMQIKKSWITRFIEDIKGYKIKKATLPDLFYLWSFDLYKVAKRKISEEKFEHIITFGQPMSCHVAGLRLKNKFPKIKWIAHFSDPWVDNPFNTYNFWTFFLNKSFQNRVFKTADKLIFTSLETINLVMKDYPDYIRAKAEYLPHSFNPALYPKDQKKSKKVTIRYLGNFYGNRQPDTFLKALTLLKNQKIHVEFIGAGETTIDKIKALKLDKIVSVKAEIPYLDSLKIMSQTDLLLVIDADSEQSVFFPSKLADYIGANRLLFGITPQGTSQKIIEELGGLTAKTGDPVEIAQKLQLMLNRIKLGEHQLPSENQLLYRISVVGKKAYQIITSI